MKTLYDLLEVAGAAGLTVELSMLSNVTTRHMVATVRQPGSIAIIDNPIVNPDYTVSDLTFEAFVRNIERRLKTSSKAPAAEAPLKWFAFPGLPLLRCGRATEEQAREYAEIRARRRPGVSYVELDGAPADESTIINLDVALSVARHA